MSILFAMLAAAFIPAGQTFSCTPVAVYDGDGPIWCAEGPKIRLAGIAAREMDGSCRTNQPCPKVSAEQSRDKLAELVGVPIGRRREGHVLVRGPTMRCLSVGKAKGARNAAWCVAVTCRALWCEVNGPCGGSGTGKGSRADVYSNHGFRLTDRIRADRLVIRADNAATYAGIRLIIGRLLWPL